MPRTIPIEELGVDVSGGRLAAFRLGAERAGAPLVLAVHGVTSNSRAWLPLARALDGRADLVAVNLRGRAASNQLPGPYGFAAHTADLLAVLDQLESERAVLVGQSLGAYVVARFAVEHRRRVHAAVLVDGGLTLPGSEGVDPQEFVTAFLGPTLARLKLTFPSREAYHDWWRQHPAIVGSDVAHEDLVAYAEHDLTGSAPELRCSVAEAAVRADAGELAATAEATHRLGVPATLLVAPRGLQNDPHPLQPLDMLTPGPPRTPRGAARHSSPASTTTRLRLGRRAQRPLRRWSRPASLPEPVPRPVVLRPIDAGNRAPRLRRWGGRFRCSPGGAR